MQPLITVIFIISIKIYQRVFFLHEDEKLYKELGSEIKTQNLTPQELLCSSQVTELDPSHVGGFELDCYVQVSSLWHSPTKAGKKVLVWVGWVFSRLCSGVFGVVWFLGFMFLVFFFSLDDTKPLKF